MAEIALISPRQSAVSETFIKAHKDLLSGNIHYYYGEYLPADLENEGNVIDKLNIFTRAFRYYMYKEKAPYKPALEKSFKKNKIEVVLAEYGPTGSTVLPVCKSLGIPLITHFHGYDAHCLDILEKYGSAYKELFEYCKYIIVVSKYMQDAICKLGAAPDKVILNPCGPNEIFHKIKTDPVNSKKIICLGRFVDKKAPYYNIMAFKDILDFCPDAELVMIGDGVLRETCRNLARQYGISGKVTFTGALSVDAVARELSGARIFLQHSVVTENGDSEGTPVGILEAQAAGIPVVSTKHAGIVDAVIDKKTGFLADEHDINAIVAFLKLLLSDDNLVSRMGISAKKHIHDNYSMARHIRLINNAISDAVKQR
ncbi:MAG: glycosyltransferase [Victivallales bacterium]